MNFTLENNLEFYCYLKASLPKGYSIISEPSKHYYSEWYFHYKIYKGKLIIKELRGNFKKIDNDYLIKEAETILNEIKK